MTNALVSQESLGIPSTWDKQNFDGQQVDSPTDCHAGEIVAPNTSVMTTTHPDINEESQRILDLPSLCTFKSQV